MEKTKIDTTGQGNRDYLLDVAKNVSTWIINPVIRERFRKQIKAFCDNRMKWLKKSGKQKPDPLDYLVLPYTTHLEAHIGRLIEDDKPKQLSMPFEEEKSLQADYVLLTIIHDKRLESPRTPYISYGIWSKDEEWVNSKWDEICRGRINESRDMQEHIELALHRVEADLKKTGQKSKPQGKDGQAGKKQKNRPIMADMQNRNKAVAMAAAKFQAEHDRLPTVDDIMDETKYTRQQIYATGAYKEGKVAKRSVKVPTEMTGSSVYESERFSRTSELHSRATKRTKAEQAELDALIDEQNKEKDVDEKMQKRLPRQGWNAEDA